MKLLQIFNAVVLALTAIFAVTLGVVCLMYAVNLDTSPRMRAEWPTVAAVTSVFWVLSIFAGLALWAQRRRHGWRWIAQAISGIALIAGAVTLVRVLQA